MVWVWSTKATSDGTRVSESVPAESYIGVTGFTVCPSGRYVCKVGNLATGRADELEVNVHVLSKAASGDKVRLTAKASAKRSRSDSASATYVVVRTLKPSPTTAVPTLPASSLPPLPSTSSSSNPAGLFPTVPTSPSPGTSGSGFPRVKPHSAHAATASATVPLDARLIGGQLAGLAVLAGGIAIALVRLSLRRQRLPGGNDPAGPAK